MSAFVKLLGGATVAAFAGACALAFWFDAAMPTVAQTFLLLSITLVFLCAAVLFTGYVIHLAIVEREPSPLVRIRHDCTRFFRPTILVDKLGPLVLGFVLLGAFGTYKSLITRIQPFYLDGFLSDLDRAILGTDAWRITHAAFGQSGTRFLELSYRLWFGELSLSLIYFSLFAAEELRRRFFYAFFLIWSVIGFIMATAMSSAGPCFLNLIHHPYANRYADLLPLIRQAPVALAAQQMLADAYLGGKAGAYLGISAMPSMHVSYAALAALALGAIDKRLGIAGWCFCAIIIVGSVHLGYHYLSDGIVGALATVVIWKALSWGASQNRVFFSIPGVQPV